MSDAKEYVSRCRDEIVEEVYKDSFITNEDGTVLLQNANEKLQPGNIVTIFYNTNEPITLSSNVMMIILGNKILINRFT